MMKARNAVSALAISATVLTGTATSALAAESPNTTSRTVAASCTKSGAFCATSDRGGSPLLLTCRVSLTVPKSWRSTGGGYWNNRLPRNGVVRMFGDNNTVKYVTPPNYGPVRGDWTHIKSLRADC